MVVSGLIWVLEAELKSSERTESALKWFWSISRPQARGCYCLLAGEEIKSWRAGQILRWTVLRQALRNLEGAKLRELKHRVMCGAACQKEERGS